MHLRKVLKRGHVARNYLGNYGDLGIDMKGCESMRYVCMNEHLHVISEKAGRKKGCRSLLVVKVDCFECYKLVSEPLVR